MELKQAEQIAEKYLNLFKPYCERIEIAGSVRRKKSQPDDVELVCVPKTECQDESNLFETVLNEGIRQKEFIQLVNSFPRVKGNGEGKYARLILPDKEAGHPLPPSGTPPWQGESICLDLFITTPEQWGVIFMIRTGSSRFSTRMVTEIKSKGFYVKDGWLWKNNPTPTPFGDSPWQGENSCNERIECKEERDFFEITKQPWVDPEMRYF
jgi:DNA polymerase/3'-5' exonuclease PolX